MTTRLDEMTAELTAERASRKGVAKPNPTPTPTPDPNPNPNFNPSPTQERGGGSA